MTMSIEHAPVIQSQRCPEWCDRGHDFGDGGGYFHRHNCAGPFADHMPAEVTVEIVEWVPEDPTMGLGPEVELIAEGNSGSVGLTEIRDVLAVAAIGAALTEAAALLDKIRAEGEWSGAHWFQVSVLCPATNEPVWTNVDATPALFRQMQEGSVFCAPFKCGECGAIHKWSGTRAALDPIPTKR
ncbi:MAG: hypothetical protein QOH56_2809 [Pseudonocardiales bacterium]|jgi:hypothetical protein|nr:hypothetical protein [Pseudonocardiales bacterium]